MPLEKAAPGTEGFKNNIETEIAAGKPQKQAIAIAYRMSGEKRDDGEIGEPFATGPHPINQQEHPLDRALREAQNLYHRADACAHGGKDGEDE